MVALNLDQKDKNGRVPMFERDTGKEVRLYAVDAREAKKLGSHVETFAETKPGLSGAKPAKAKADPTPPPSAALDATKN